MGGKEEERLHFGTQYFNWSSQMMNWVLGKGNWNSLKFVTALALKNQQYAQTPRGWERQAEMQLVITDCKQAARDGKQGEI